MLDGWRPPQPARIEARFRGSCAAKYVPTVLRYWRVFALVRDVYWTGSFVSESYRLVENRSSYLGCAIQRGASCKVLSSGDHVFDNVLLLVSGSLNRELVRCFLLGRRRKDGPDQS